MRATWSIGDFKTDQLTSEGIKKPRYKAGF